MLRRLSRRLLLLTSLILLLGGGWLLWYAGTAVVPPSLPATFVVEPGSSLRKVARQLHNQGMIRHPDTFIALGRLLGFAGKLKAGSYLLERPASPYQLFNKLTLGETLLAKLTVIEGWSFRQMRAALDAHPRVRHDAAVLTDQALLAEIGAAETYPEGLFFPDTYYFDEGASDLDIYREAYATLHAKLDQAWQGRAPGLPYTSPYQVLIMASIIEKETGAEDERPLIAAVFINRLRIGMRLQTDPTVIYGLGERYDGNLRKEHLLADTPFNTYTRAGLPPTPIALPSQAAIEAALHPADSPALYFVAKGGGRHHFSRTLEEHNRAVNRYQRGGG